MPYPCGFQPLKRPKNGQNNCINDPRKVWITIKGTHVEIGEGGELKGTVGAKIQGVSGKSTTEAKLNKKTIRSAIKAKAASEPKWKKGQSYTKAKFASSRKNTKTGYMATTQKYIIDGVACSGVKG